MSDTPAPDELFAGTALDYVRHRPPYPPELLAALAARFRLGPGVGVLDLGCGPGVLSLPLADTGAAVTGVDPSAEMLAMARHLAGGRANLRWVHGTAEEAPLAGPYRLAVCGRSFHWLDRARVLARLERLLEADGAVVVFGEHRAPGREAAWRPLLA
ncbi:MAG: class I SAM-dependent methyltransferase, partial [Alphaproteobacteria bacterium]